METRNKQTEGLAAVHLMKSVDSVLVVSRRKWLLWKESHYQKNFDRARLRLRAEVARVNRA